MTNQRIKSNNDEHPRPHFVLVPMMAQGHMIPMIDFAQLLARHGALVTFITTPYNASRVRPTIDRAKNTGASIRFIEIPLPCKEMGLPESCENIDIVPSGLMMNFFEGLSLLAEPLEKYLRQHRPHPDCMIADLCHPWTQEVADNLRIPRLTFFGICCFTLFCAHNIACYKVHDIITDEHEPYDVPGLTQKIMVTKDQARVFFADPGWEKFLEKVHKAEDRADGIVVNTFDDLELLYIESYQKAKGKKVWALGPFSLCNKDPSEMAIRGDKASIDVERCLSWLDSMKPKSVIYVSFGSLTVMRPQQLMEIGLGLEDSNHPFIWVIKKHEMPTELKEWLLEGFEERIRPRGLIIKGWAPQVLILSHPAIGGFMTHCGWNSTLECVSAGVPMIAWPHFADQFLNERMVVEVLNIGISAGAKKRSMYVDRLELLVDRENVKKAVKGLMDGGEEAEERRKKAAELGKKARKAMTEGGSSYDNMTGLIKCYSVK